MAPQIRGSRSDRGRSFSSTPATVTSSAGTGASVLPRQSTTTSADPTLQLPQPVPASQFQYWSDARHHQPVQRYGRCHHQGRPLRQSRRSVYHDQSRLQRLPTCRVHVRQRFERRDGFHDGAAQVRPGRQPCEDGRYRGRVRPPVPVEPAGRLQGFGGAARGQYHQAESRSGRDAQGPRPVGGQRQGGLGESQARPADHLRAFGHRSARISSWPSRKRRRTTSRSWRKSSRSKRDCGPSLRDSELDRDQAKIELQRAQAPWTAWS